MFIYPGKPSGLASEQRKIAIMFAIADLLKRLQTEKSSNEALEMAYETLKVDPDDPFEVWYFVLDVALEIGKPLVL